MAPKKKGGKQPSQNQQAKAKTGPHMESCNAVASPEVVPAVPKANKNEDSLIVAQKHAQLLTEDNRSGRRQLINEKNLLSELSRMLHVIKATDRAKQIELKNKKKAASKDSWKGEERQRKDKKRRRLTKRASSVVLTFKGGLRAVPVRPVLPATSEATANAAAESLTKTRRTAAAARHRGDRNVALRLAAVAAATEYMESAREQAKEAGFYKADGSLTSDGDSYIKEQLAVARDMLKPRPTIGDHTLSLLGDSALAASALSRRAQTEAKAVLQMTLREPHLPPDPSKADREAFEDALAQERALLTKGGEATDPIDFEGERASLYYTLQQPAGLIQENEATSASGQGNSMCIIKAKGPQNIKSTSIIYTKTQVNAVHQRLFTDLLRREVYPFLLKDEEGKKRH